MTFWKWSRTASVNATADSTCPFPEGMAPSAVNDGVRGLMAAAAKYRDDVSGATVTGGTSSAYTLTTNQGFTAPIADGTGLAFWAHTTNAAGATLSVDGTGAVPFMAPITVPLPAGVLVAGTPYRIRYTNFPGWVLEGMFGQVYSIPIGGFMPYLSTTPPNSSFVLPYGQPVSRSIYATLFAMIGTTFGVGDGSSTFNIPDLRGRTIVGQDVLGSDGQFADIVTSGGSGLNSRTFGARGGSQNKTLARSDLPNVAPTASFTGIQQTWSTNQTNIDFGSGDASGPTGGRGVGAQGQASVTITPAGTVAVESLNGGVAQTSLAILQPSIILPMLLRVI